MVEIDILVLEVVGGLIIAGLTGTVGAVYKMYHCIKKERDEMWKYLRKQESRGVRHSQGIMELGSVIDHQRRTFHPEAGGFQDSTPKLDRILRDKDGKF